MRILFDHGTPAPPIPFLRGPSVTKARERGWDRISNGELLNAAEAAGFDAAPPSVLSCLPLADARGSEALAPNRDREGAVVKSGHTVQVDGPGEK